MIDEFDPQVGLRDHDVCVVGSGPVGLALALRCAAKGLRVVILESGPNKPGPGPGGAEALEIVDPRRHAPGSVVAARALGGTSHWWGGRCVPFDRYDFSSRPWAPGAAWPIGFDDVAPWLLPACEFLGCPPAQFEVPGEELAGARFDTLERWAPEPNMARAHAAALKNNPDVLILQGVTVTGLRLSETGARVAQLDVVSRAGMASISPVEVVLACGGIETTRLLLCAQQSHPQAFGGVDGPLGRFYMGHVSGKIADIALRDPADAARHDFVLNQGVYTRRRLTLSDEAMRKAELLNISFWADNPRFHDSDHRDPLLSLVWLILAIPGLGRRLMPEGVRIGHLGPDPRKVVPHLRNVTRRPDVALAQLSRLVAQRYIQRPRRPGFLLRNRAGRYALHFHSEHSPHENSRILLSREMDQNGVPRARVDLRFSSRDLNSVVAAHEHLDAALQSSGIARLCYHCPPAGRFSEVDRQAADGFHQIGTTRMSAEPSSGIVDPDCNVHGVENLHIASSSVFPSSSQANPTLLAVSLALRLADRISSKLNRNPGC